MSDNKKFGEVSREDIELASQAEPEDIKEKKIDIKDEILEWVESFVFAMFVVVLIFTFFFRIVLVEGTSMTNTLQNEDRLIISHLNYSPERDDIVVINSQVLNKTIIKRVIGVEGDKVIVDYNENTVTVNDEVISNEHIKEVMFDTGLFNTNYEIADGVYEYDVPEGCIFAMGDNRNGSKDSRTIGFVPNEDVLGKAVLRLFPFDSFGKVA